jgi:phosphoglycerate dehydrogenase-like enzyme
MSITQQKTVLIWTGSNDSSIAQRLQHLSQLRPTVATDFASWQQQLAHAEILIANTASWTTAMSAAVDQTTALRWIQLINAGYDNIEAYGLAPHIALTTRGGIGKDVISEHVLTLLLGLARQIPACMSAKTEGRWGLGTAAAKVSSISNMHIALVGYGPIGQLLKQRLEMFGARVSVVAMRRRVEPDGTAIAPLADLPQLLPQTDAVILACPLTPETLRLFDAKLLSRMKPGGLLVNIARGQVVDTEAMMAALESGQLGGAGLDVTDPEPLPKGHALWRFPNVIVTPHMAFSGGGARIQNEIELLILDNMQRYLRGDALLHRATPDPRRATARKS